MTEQENKPYSMFEDAKQFPNMSIGEERRGVSSMTLQSITRHDRFVHTLEIVYVDLVDDERNPGKKIPRREKLLIPPSRGITIDVVNVDGMKTIIHHFPIQIFDEVWTSTPVTPYTSPDEKVTIPAKVKLITVSDIWGVNGIVVEKDGK